MRDRAFWGLTITQFLGAFNDNLFKQLMLLLAVPVGIAALEEQDQQGLATIVFSLPFVLFSGYAGFLSDRFSKRPIIVLCKVAEIAAMLLGTAGFLLYAYSGYTGLLVVLFLMGTHSAFFGPGKYGILPEMFRAEDLPRANGLILMTTFLAIIFGTASAGLLGDLVDPNLPLVDSARKLWIGSAACVGIAVAGALTSLLIRAVPAAQPDLRFRPSTLAIPPETRALLRRDRPLFWALMASCAFWMVSGIAIQVVNSFGLVQLALSKKATSAMTAVIAIGIAAGAVVAGRLCHGRADFRLVRLGAWGMVASMLVLSLPSPTGQHLLGLWGSLPLLVLIGMAAGFFAIPVQVFIQTRPPKEQKGRMIAVMNIFNFFAILLAGVVYWTFDRITVALDLPRSTMFAMMAALMLPVALWYHPVAEPDHKEGD
jgi:acyl-[acyl-carrier-protein]-phospholipid O-acyltransferase/long-chain-fatty-acid--[acyl-carrier-protein] ligase